MPLYDLFKACRRALNLFDHGYFDVAISDDIRICLVFLLSFFSSTLSFESRLVEVHIFSHDDRLQTQ